MSLLTALLVILCPLAGPGDCKPPQNLIPLDVAGEVTLQQCQSLALPMAAQFMAGQPEGWRIDSMKCAQTEETQ